MSDKPSSVQARDTPEAFKEFELDGKKMRWQPALGFSILYFGGIESIHFEGEPSLDRFRDMFIGYAQGKQQGVHIGRCNFQQEIANLLGFQQY